MEGEEDQVPGGPPKVVSKIDNTLKKSRILLYSKRKTVEKLLISNFSSNIGITKQNIDFFASEASKENAP